MYDNYDVCQLCCLATLMLLQQKDSACLCLQPGNCHIPFLSYTCCLPGTLIAHSENTVTSTDGDATITLKPGQVHPELFTSLSTNTRQRHGSKAPEAGHIHLTPDTDPENTFRTRHRASKPRVRFQDLQTMFTSDSSNHGTPFQNGTSSNRLDGTDSTPASDDQLEVGAGNV